MLHRHHPCGAQAGMDKQLRTLVDLEALLNDGTAYVLFFLLRVWAEGRRQSAGDAIRRAPAVLFLFASMVHAYAQCTTSACTPCDVLFFGDACPELTYPVTWPPA